MKRNKKIIVANWKMNPALSEDAKKLFSKSVKLFEASNKVSAIICPPFVYLSKFKVSNSKNKKVSIGAQDCWYERSGAFTGLISPIMLSDMGVSHVIVGHSESRKRGEVDDVVNKKMLAVIDSGMTAIVCIGEEKRNDSGDHLTFLRDQIEKNLKGLNKNNIKKVIIAYEPVWAIGASFAMDPHSIYETSLFIKKIINEKFKILINDIVVLYGGSVDSSNASSIIKESNVDGLLIGRQSLEVDSLKEMIESIDR